MMMMMGTMMEPSPIEGSAGHMGHSHSTMQQKQHGGTIDHLMGGTSHSFSADEMAQLLRNSGLGRGLEDVSSSFTADGGNGGDEGSTSDQDDSAKNNYY